MEQQERGRRQGGQAQQGDEEGRGPEERQEVGDGRKDGQREEEDLVLLVGGGISLGEGLDEVFLFWYFLLGETVRALF